MRQTAKVIEISKTIERLKGILIGISIDQKINDIEIANLYDWVMENEYLHQIEPFKSTVSMLQQILADGIITEDERAELMDWCSYFSGPGRIPVEYSTKAIRQLHGTVHGLILDSEITDDEIISFKKWLGKYSIFRDIWPFSDFHNIVEQILEDGKITPSERSEFYRFCSEFSEIRITDAEIHDPIYQENWMRTHGAVFRPFTYYCDKTACITFQGKCFCFTGPARYGTRSKLHDIVWELGGRPAGSVSASVDYLVIGSQSSPCWAYSTYGRKIEAAINMQADGKGIIILHEDDFLRQAQVS